MRDRWRHSVDTTMGFSPQSGLENATRHGDLDVFAVLYMMERHGWSIEEVRRQLAKAAASRASPAWMAATCAIWKRPRPAAAPGRTGAGRVRLSGQEDHWGFRGGDGRAGRDRLHRRHRRELGALARTVLRGPGLPWRRIDPAANAASSGDRIVSSPDSRVTVMALATNEELVVARRAYRCLQIRNATTA